MTREEIQEEYDFLDACMDTKVFQIAKDFMVEKGIKVQICVVDTTLYGDWFYRLTNDQLCVVGVLGSDDPELLRRILHR